MLVNTNGTIKVVIRAFAQLTGFSLDEIVGKPCTILNCDGCEKTLLGGGENLCNLKEVKGVSREAMDAIMNYRQPGNVRELKSALEYAFVLLESPLLGIDELPTPITSSSN